MKQFFFLLFVAITSSTAFGQRAKIITESWNANPTLHSIDKKHEQESAVIILDKRRIEYVDEGGDLAAYRTLHKIIRVNDDKGIENFNTIYLGISDNADLVDIKARTILPNKKVIELDRKNIKDLKDEDGTQYKIFAMEGLEKGCEVEYYYTYKGSSSVFGREILQGPFPVQQVKVEVVAPERLVYEIRLYNTNNIKVKSDTSSTDGKKFIAVNTDVIEGAAEEKYSVYTANLARLEYKLSYNLSRTAKERLFTWNEMAKRIYEAYSTASDKEIKRVKNFLEDNKWDKLTTDEEKIVAVENYLKKNIATREDIGDEANNLERIIKNKIASHQGIIRLYGNIYNQLGVEYQFVLAGNRSDFTIDKTFENWNNSENPLLYFPKAKKYLAPTRLDYRYPFIYAYWGSTNGLFCKGTTIGSFTTALAEIKPVTLENYSASASSIDAVLKLNPGLDTMFVTVKQQYTGYPASFYRTAFNFSSAEDQRSYLKELVKFGTNSENIVESKIENKDFESYSTNKPFVLQASVKATELLERAGNKVLIKIGDVIGQQSEMYEEKSRQFPMEIEYPHVLQRTIQLHIPEGYTIKNANDIKTNVVYRENGEVTMGFVSDYTQEGNILKVNIIEEYRNTTYPLAQYEDFKKVINAAADFNKVVLVLEKK